MSVPRTKKLCSAVGIGKPNRDSRPRADGSFNRGLDRIIRRIEMLEIMIGFLRKQMDTVGLALK